MDVDGSGGIGHPHDDGGCGSAGPVRTSTGTTVKVLRLTGKEEDDVGVRVSVVLCRRRSRHHSRSSWRSRRARCARG